jgi:hypothetical protein
MIIYAPVIKPAAPHPWTALPTMSAGLFGDAASRRSVRCRYGNAFQLLDRDIPQIKLPISKRDEEAMKIGFSGKYLYSLPQVAWNAESATKKADPYQPNWSRDRNSSVILGIAVATMLCFECWSESPDRERKVNISQKLIPYPTLPVNMHVNSGVYS